MPDTVSDLYRHQAWADAEHWRALLGHPPALADERLFERLHHLHNVQRAFLAVARDDMASFQHTRPADFTPATLLAWAREAHAAGLELVAGLTPERLAGAVTIPWFKDPPLRITLAEALTQAAMHSHYHRGQNAARLRELGGTPPLTDLIVWYWKGRPPAGWPEP